MILMREMTVGGGFDPTVHQYLSAHHQRAA